MPTHGPTWLGKDYIYYYYYWYFCLFLFGHFCRMFLVIQFPIKFFFPLKTAVRDFLKATCHSGHCTVSVKALKRTRSSMHSLYPVLLFYPF